MIDLAEHRNGSFIPLKDIAARQEISKKYLEIIVKTMVEGGLIKGLSGKGGGSADMVQGVFGEVSEEDIRAAVHQVLG